MNSHIETASTTEAAKIYKVSARQLFNLVKAKQIPPPVRVGKRRLVWLVSDIQDFLRAGGTPAFNTRRSGRPRKTQDQEGGLTMRTQTTSDPDCARSWVITNEILTDMVPSLARGDYDYSYDGGERMGEDTASIAGRSAERLPAHDLKTAEYGRLLKKYPHDGADYQVLLWLSSGFTIKRIAAGLDRTDRAMRYARARLDRFKKTGFVRRLPPSQVRTGKDLTKPLPKSRAGRKRNTSPGNALAAPILVLVPCVPTSPKVPRVTVQRPRHIVVADPSQLDFGWGMAAWVPPYCYLGSTMSRVATTAPGWRVAPPTVTGTLHCG